MNKGINNEEQYQIIELENIGKAYVNMNKENNNVHCMLPILETNQPLNIDLILVYNWKSDNKEYDGDIYGFYILGYYKKLTKDNEVYKVKEADETIITLKKIMDNYYQDEDKKYSLITNEDDEKYVLMSGNNQYIYEKINRKYPNKIIIDKNEIVIGVDGDNRIKEIISKRSGIVFKYSKQKATAIEYYEQNYLVKKIVFEQDQSDGSIKIKKYCNNSLLSEVTFSDYHVINLYDIDFEHIFEFDSVEKNLIKYTKKYKIEGNEEQEELNFNYENNISKVIYKDKIKTYKYNNKNKIETIIDAYENVKQYEYLSNDKISSINEAIFKPSIINKYNLLIKEADNKVNKFGYICTSNVTLDKLSGTETGINFTLTSKTTNIGNINWPSTESISKEIEYRGNEKDAITLTFKYKFLKVGTQLGNYSLELFKDGKSIKTYSYTFNKNNVKTNVETYVIETKRIEEPCDKVVLKIAISNLSSAIIYNPVITETNNLAIYNYEEENFKSLTQSNDFTNYYYDDTNKNKEITQFDLDSNLDNYGQNKEGYTNSIQNAYGLINGTTYDESDIIDDNHFGSHNVIEKGSYFNNTYISEMYHYFGQYIDKINDKYGMTSEIVMLPTLNKVALVTTPYQGKQYDYNDFGQIIYQKIFKDDDKSEINYAYNEKHLLNKITLPNSESYEFTYTLDSLNLLSKVTYNGTKLIEYYYNNGKMSSIKYGGEDEIKTYDYDEKDNLIEVKYGTTSELTSLYRYEYDDFDRIIKVRDMGNESQDLSFGYDINGNIAKVENEELKINYTYDNGSLINTVTIIDQKQVSEHIKPHMVDELLKEAYYHVQRTSKVDARIYYCFFNEVGIDGKRLSTSLKSYCIDENDVRKISILPEDEDKLPNVVMENNLNYIHLEYKNNNYLTYNYEVFPYQKEIKSNAASYLFYNANLVEKENHIFEMTYGVWFRIKENPKYEGTIISLGEYGQSSVAIKLDENGKIKLVARKLVALPEELYKTEEEISKNTWHFVCLSIKYKGNTWEAGIDTCGLLYECSLIIDGNYVYYNNFSDGKLINLHMYGGITKLMIGAERGFEYGGIVNQLNLDVTNVIYSNNKKLTYKEIYEIYQSMKTKLIDSDIYETVDFKNATSDALIMLNEELVNDENIELFPLHNTLNSIKGTKPISVSVDHKYNLDSRKLFRHLDSVNRTCYKAIGQKLVYDLNLLSKGTIQVNAYFINSLETQCVFSLKDNIKELEIFTIYNTNGKLYLRYEYDYDEYATILIDNQIAEGLNCISLSYQKEENTEEEITTYSVRVKVNESVVKESTITLPYLTNNHLVYLGRFVNRDGDNEKDPNNLVGAVGTFFDMLVISNNYMSNEQMSSLQSKINNITVANYYNAYGLKTFKLIKEDNNSQGIVSNHYEYEEENDGRIKPRVKKEEIRYKGNNKVTLNYSYDEANRLISCNDFNDYDYEYSYDYLNQLVNEKIDNIIQEYRYDGNGNIIRSKRQGINKLYEYSLGKLVKIYDYGTEEIDESKKDLMAYEEIIYNNNSYYPSQVIGYDINRNIIKNISYTWRQNQLIEYVDSKNRKTVQYEYNASGLISKKIVITKNRLLKTTIVTTDYLYEGNLLISECIIRNNVIVSKKRYYYDENGQVISLKINDTKYYYIKDVIGRINGIIDSSGAVINRYSYDGFGNVIDDVVSIDNNILYKGYYYDEDIGLYICGSRYYNPEIGRFIDPNVILNFDSLSGNINLYSYTKNPGCNGSNHYSEVYDFTSSSNEGNAFYSNSSNILGSLNTLLSAFSYFDKWSGYLSSGFDAGLKMFGPNGFPSFKKYSNISSKIGAGLVIVGSILSWGSSVYNNFTNPNYTIGEAFGASIMDVGYYALKGAGTYYAGIGVGKAAVGLGIAAGGAAIIYLGVGFAAAIAIGGVVAVVVGIAGAVAIYYLGELLDYGWSELKKALFE